jgi:hypothetical protein
MNIKVLVMVPLCRSNHMGVRAHDAADLATHGQLADALSVERLKEGRQAGLLGRGIVEFVAVEGGGPGQGALVQQAAIAKDALGATDTR